MRLTVDEKKMLDGAYGEPKAKALDYLIQFGDAFGAERFIDVIYAHYPAEMSIYRGTVEDAVEYAATGAKACIPTTSSTLGCDLDQWRKQGCPKPLADLQAKIIDAHAKMGVLGTYTCTPQLLGFIPPKDSYIISVESSAIIYFNSVLGARTNRGGVFTRYSAVTGKYPLMGYLLDANRRGTHLINVDLEPEELRSTADYSALGFAVGDKVGGDVPVFDRLGVPKQEDLLALGAALATSGSVTLFHAPGHTAEAQSIDEAFAGTEPRGIIQIGKKDIASVYEKLTNSGPDDEIDFVTLGCPHYNLEQIRFVAEWLAERHSKVHRNVRLWVCTNRMTKASATWLGYTQIIEDAGGLVICDSCPVESHMRVSTCHEYGLATPQVKAMASDSCKMLRYVGDLIGCKTALMNRDTCLAASVSGVFKP